MEITYQIVRGDRRAATQLNELTVVSHLEAMDTDAFWDTPATDKVQSFRLLEQVTGTCWRRATLVQTHVTFEVPCYRVTVRGVQTLGDRHLRTTGLMQ